MNAKYVVALILALQVSVSLCDIPQPSQELLEKYNEMRNTFMKRIANIAGKAQLAAAPYMDGEHAQNARNRMEELQSKPEFQTFVAIMTKIAEDAAPLVDMARSKFLGIYEQSLRPTVGDTLSQVIDHIKVVLDKYMPSE